MDRNKCKASFSLVPWTEHLDRSTLQSCGDSILPTSLKNLRVTCRRQIKTLNVYQAINRTCDSKAGGLGHITANYLEYARLFMFYWVYDLWSLLPDSVLSAVLGSVVKDKTEQIRSLDNYRPVALDRILSKVLEIITLDRIIEFIHSTDNQCVFKSKHGSGFCLFALQGDRKQI